MIYYETKIDDFLQTLFNLEELVCLSHILKQKINLKTSDKIKKIFDLKEFNLVDEIPNGLSKINISDNVCMFNTDVDDFEGSEFLFYFSEQKGSLLRMDIFKNLDCELQINKINFYESKYYFSDNNTYLDAISSAAAFDINKELFFDFNYLLKIIKSIPLLCLDKVDLTKTYSFDFSECYYISSSSKVKDFLIEHNISGYDLKDYLYNFNIKNQDYDVNLLCYLVKDKFTEIYGTPHDNIFNSFLKSKYKKNVNFEPNILESQDVSLVNYKMQDINLSAIYSWIKKNIHCDRNELLNFVRLRECVNSIV